MSDIAVECSPFFNRLVDRYPDGYERLRTTGRLETTSPPQAGSLQKAITRAGLDAGLRQFRNHEMMRLIWRDLNNQAAVEETLTDLSLLADICLQAAIKHHNLTLETTHGTPRNATGEAQQLVVIGLGKLGGNELNMSSDIDIVFCYPEKGVCDGRRELANEQYFTRLARKVIRSLSQVTADGFCFRVDTRLRPFGDSGPLVSNFAALEQYYQREGRDWERYALIKSRVVAGDQEAGACLLEILKPFVYRRYIDFGAIEALQEMHQNVRDDARRHDRLDDVKRGPGGIREIEFLVQSFQLLRGGRESALQTPSIFKALDQLREQQLLPNAAVNGLLSSYCFLRRVENRIQALHDQQTHTVPEGEDGMRVAHAMGFESLVDFQTALGDKRSQVQSIFANSLPQHTDSQRPGQENSKDQWHQLWQRVRNNVQDAGVDHIDWKPLTDFARRLNRLSLSQRAARRLDKFMPMLLQHFKATSCTDEVMNRVLDLVSAICRRSAYLSLLLQNPAATEQMLSLFARSERVAKTVTRYPALLDELIDPGLGAHPPTQEDIEAGVKRALKGQHDTETTLQNLNYYKQTVFLQIAVAVLRSTLSVLAVQRVLSQLAECVIRAVLKLSIHEMEARHGSLPGPELAIIAYGSLGASAPNLDSDLDLIFLYTPEPGQSTGSRPIQAERFHTGVARRMLSLLSATTPSGRLYTIDARLRPNGRSGLLVSSVAAFGRYQRHKAWVWELQALTRARFVAGSSIVRDAFTVARQQALTVSRDHETLVRDLKAMRVSVAQHHVNRDPLKQAPGGLVDIEFVVQLGILLNAENHNELTSSTRLRDQLQALQACGWLKRDVFEALNSAYSQLCQARQENLLLKHDSTKPVLELLRIAGPVCDSILR